MRKLQVRIKKARVPPKYFVRQTVRISKKMKFVKAFVQNCNFEVFSISKLLRRSPRPLYDLEDLPGDWIDGNYTPRSSL